MAVPPGERASFHISLRLSACAADTVNGPRTPPAAAAAVSITSRGLRMYVRKVIVPCALVALVCLAAPGCQQGADGNLASSEVASASVGASTIGYRTPPAPRYLGPSHINVMGPLLVDNVTEFRAQLKKAKDAGADAVTVDVWWGRIQ